MIPSNSTYNFLFHPLHGNHTNCVKTLSLFTSIALSVLTCGLYFVVFTFVHLKERHITVANPNSNQATSQTNLLFQHKISNKASAVKAKLQNHLAKLQRFASRGEWKHLQTHTEHPDSGFDWWMFPTDRASQGYGSRYQLSASDIGALRKDKEFMQSYRQGVILVAQSWGWDLEKEQDISNKLQHWTNYQVRLGKMLHSLTLFSQFDLRDKLNSLIDQKGLRPSLQKWIQSYLS